MIHQPSEVRHDLSPWFRDGLFLSQSAIDGVGVFTMKAITEPEAVMRIGGRFFAASERRTSAVLTSTAIAVAEDLLLGEPAESQRDLSDYLNHCCAPNLGFADAVTLVASRLIEAGEELTVDYAYWEADETWVLKSPCHCGAAGCRRRITGSDWRRHELEEALTRWASPFIRRRICARRRERG